MKKIKSTTAKKSGSFTIGRDAFASISAVEGLRITAAMEADFREFDRKGLSASQRRSAIARKYGRAR